MTGIALLALGFLWVFLAGRFAIWIASLQKYQVARWCIGLLVFVIGLPMPLADEIVGKWQFEALCKQYAVQMIDEQHAMNRRVLYEPRGADQFAQRTAVEIRIDPVVYRDAETNQVLVSYHTLHAKGGWLIRALGISETSSPLLFQRGCAPKDQDAFKKKFNITVVN